MMDIDKASSEVDESGGNDVARPSIWDDPEMEGLSLYEKKALLVNRELDSHGMARYQWWIWGLCGFGYFIDLMWAQAFGLVVKPMQIELGFPDSQLGNLSTSFSAGLTAGAFVWGVLVDLIGRQYAFNLTVLISSIFGLCLGAPSTYNGVIVLTAFVGIGVGGNIPIDTTICLEFLPQACSVICIVRNRRFLLALLSIFQPLGVVVTSGITYGLIPKYSCNSDLPSCKNVAAGVACCTRASNMGWRYTLFTLGGITLFAFIMRFVVFRFQESPKFLLYRNKDEKAIEVLQKIAKFNGRESHVTLEMFQALDEQEGRTPKDLTTKQKVRRELKRYKLLFATPAVSRLTILIWVVYVFDYWGFTVAGSFLPSILFDKNKAIDVSVSETYRDYIIIYAPGIAGVMLGALMYGVPLIGRKWGMVISSALMGISLFLFATVNTQASNVGLNMMEYFFQSMFNAILYGWTPEVFPATIRGTACGVASFWGRLFSIVSPLIAQHIYATSINGVLYMAGSVVFISTIAILLIPTRSMGAQSY